MLLVSLFDKSIKYIYKQYFKTLQSFMSNKFWENLKAVALAASIASSPEVLADENLSVRDQLNCVKTEVQCTIEKWNASSKSSLAALKQEIALNPFAISQEQGQQYADSRQTMSDVTVTDKEVLWACDTDWSGDIKGRNEAICKHNFTMDKRKAKIEKNYAEIEKLKKIKWMLQWK